MTGYLYSAVYSAVQAATGLEPYDELPGADTPYPFIVLNETEASSEAIKAGQTGEARQVVHIWLDSPDRRGDLSRIAASMLSACMRIEKAGPYSCMLIRYSSRILRESTTAVPLLHGVLELTYQYS